MFDEVYDKLKEMNNSSYEMRMNISKALGFESDMNYKLNLYT